MLVWRDPGLLAEQSGSLYNVRPHYAPVHVLVYDRLVIRTANLIRLEAKRLRQEKHPQYMFRDQSRS